MSQGSDKQSILIPSGSGDPVDMLEARKAGPAHRDTSSGWQRAESSDFARNSEGRMVIREEEVKKGVRMGFATAGGLADCVTYRHSLWYAAWHAKDYRVHAGPKPKRRPGGGLDDRASDDSDFDDLRQIGGFRRGMQSASAKSVSATPTTARPPVHAEGHAGSSTSIILMMAAGCGTLQM